MLSSDDPKFGYNAATGNYEDLMAAGIIDPTKVRFSRIPLRVADDVVKHVRFVSPKDSLNGFGVFPRNPLNRFDVATDNCRCSFLS